MNKYHFLLILFVPMLIYLILHEELNLYFKGTEATGIVDSIGYVDRNKFSISFETQKGEIIHFMDNDFALVELLESLDSGDEVKIVYLPESPQNARIKNLVNILTVPGFIILTISILAWILLLLQIFSKILKKNDK